MYSDISDIYIYIYIYIYIFVCNIIKLFFCHIYMHACNIYIIRLS